MNYEYCAGVTYTIKNGDTLYEISRRHGVPLALLLRANPYVDVFSLQAGDTICIPQKTEEELPYPMESPMQGSAEGAAEEAVENVMEEPSEKAAGPASMQAGGMAGNDRAASIQGGISGNNSSNNMRAGTSGANSPAGMQVEMPMENGQTDRKKNTGMSHTASQKAGNEQMDEMLVWSEQADLNMRKKSSSPSQEKKWCKYVVKPGDTLEDVLEEMDEDTDIFWEKNPASRLYLLPGVACYVCKK